MDKITPQEFKKIVGQFGLQIFNNNAYVLPGCNIFIEHHKDISTIMIKGVIPLEIAVEMHDLFKDLMPHHFSINGVPGHHDPHKLAKHPSLFKNGERIEHHERRGQLAEVLLHDYQNCFVNTMAVYSAPVLIWLLGHLQAYHQTKRAEKIKQL